MKVLKTNKCQNTVKRFMIVALVTTMISIFLIEARIPAEYDIIFDHAQTLYNESKYNDALKELSAISDSELIEADDTTKLFYNNLKGKIFLFKQENDSAKHYLSEAISLYESLRFKYPSYIDLLVYRAYASDALDERVDAARWYRKALIKGRVVEHNNDIDNNCYLNLGNIYNESGNYELASEYYKKINWLDSLQKIEIHPLYYSRQCDKYLQYSKDGNLTQAKAVNDSLINYCRIKYGEESDYHLVSLQSEASIQTSLRNFKLAEIANKEIIKISQRYDLNSGFVAKAYCGLIDNLCCQDSLDAAIALFPEAVEYVKNYESSTCSVFEICFSVGQCAVGLGDYEVGILALEKFLNNYPLWLDWEVPYAIHYLTWAYANVGRNEEVLSILAPLLAQGDGFSDKIQQVRPYLHKTLGCSYYILGNEAEATKHLNLAISLLPEIMTNDTLIQEILSEYRVKE